MQMGIYSIGTAPTIYPEQILQALAPIAQGASLRLDAGDALADILLGTVLAGFLAAQGIAPETAFDLARQWRPAQMGSESTMYMAEEPSVRGRRDLAVETAKNLSDEVTAAAFYTALMEQATDPTVREYIRHARDDERKHARMLSDLYHSLTGQTLTVEPESVPFADLRSGLLKAMNNEYEAFEGYRRIYLSQTNERVRALFFELMTDELEHATRFNYALQVL